MKKLKAKEAIFTENVGIGEGNPSNGLLHLNQSSNDAIRLQRSGAGVNDGNIYFGHSGGGLGVSTSGAIGVTNPDFFISSSGNVGIGTTSPNTSLEITGAWGSQFRISRDTDQGQYSEISGGGSTMKFKSVSNTHSIFTFVSDDGNGEVERMRVNAAGNVGIGTTNPNTKLHVTGNGTSTTPTLALNSSTSAAFNHSINAFNSNLETGEQQLITVGKSGSSKNSGYIGFKWDGDNSDSNILTFGHWAHDNLVNIKPNGDVGIGTTNPGSLLHLENQSFGDLLTLRTIDGTNNPRLFIGTSSTGVYIRNSHSTSAGDIDFQDGIGGSKVIMKENGNVGIGTTSPTNALNVIRSSTSGVPVAWLHNSNNTTSGNQGVTVSCINNNSNVKVFTVRSNNSTHTNGNALMEVDGQGGVYLSSLAASSDVVTNSSKQLTTSSDKRLKNDLGDCEYGLSEIMQVQPKKYTWKEGPEDQQPTIGFFAQDVHPIMPEAAPREAFKNEKDEDDYKWGLNSQTIIAALVNATKEQQSIIDDLKSQNELLKTRIENIESKI